MIALLVKDSFLSTRKIRRLQFAGDFLPALQRSGSAFGLKIKRVSSRFVGVIAVTSPNWYFAELA